MYQGGIGFFGVLKPFGTFGRMRLLGVPEGLWASLDFGKPLAHLGERDFYACQDSIVVLWIFGNLWHTLRRQGS